MIPNTKEFFISMMDHTEWGTAHSVWGEVGDPAPLVPVPVVGGASTELGPQQDWIIPTEVLTLLAS